MTSRSARLVLVAIAALAACSTPEPATPPPPPLTWPGEPEPTRIVYVGSFSRPEDLGIRKGLLQRLGEFLFGAEQARLVRPTAVVETGGVLYVADPGARGVHRFDRARGRYALLGAADGKPLLSPVGLAAGAEGVVYVTDSARAQVFVVRPGAEAAEAIVLQERLRQPTGIAVDPVTRRLYVADTGTHRILVFGRDGSLEAVIGERGTGDGQFNYPTLLWRDAGGRLYVTDSLNFRIQIFDSDGKLVAKFGRQGDGSGDLARHKGVATDRFGHVYVVDSLFNALQIFDASGRFLLSVGALGNEPGEFWLPIGVFVTPEDAIYVADSYNQRIQIFRYVGGAT